MKNKLFFAVAAFVGGLSLTGCSDLLDIKQHGVLNYDTYYKTSDQILSADATMYLTLRGLEYNLLLSKNMFSDDFYAGGAGRGDNTDLEHLNEFTFDAEQDYLQFYRQELLYRRVMSYPPEMGLLAILLSWREEDILIKAMSDLKKTVEREFCFEDPVIIGPVDASPYKVNDIYRKILYIKHGNYDILLKVQKSVQKRAAGSELYKNVNVLYDISL